MLIHFCHSYYDRSSPSFETEREDLLNLTQVQHTEGVGAAVLSTYN
jgi:hypothetical protein